MHVYHVITHAYCDIRTILPKLGCKVEYDDMATKAQVQKLGDVTEILSSSQFNSLHLEPGDYVYFDDKKDLFFIHEACISPDHAREILKKHDKEQSFQKNIRYRVKVDSNRQATLWDNQDQPVVEFELQPEEKKS